MGSNSTVVAFILTLAQIIVGVLSDITTGKLESGSVIVGDLISLLSKSTGQLLAPTVSGVTDLVQQALAVVSKATTGEASGDTALAAAVLRIFQAASTALAAVNGQPINPALVPIETPVA